MKKIVLPTILILILSSAICLIVAREYSEKRRKTLEALYNKKNVSQEMENSEEDNSDSDPVVSSKRLLAEDRCIVVGVNTKEKQISFRNIKGGDDKSLSYDGTTSFLTKNDRPLTASEICVGDVLDISFTTYDSKLSSAKQSSGIWEMNNITKFTLDENGKTLQVGDELYKMLPNGVIASGDKLGKPLDITALDSITIKGKGKEVYSIQIESGHGYIRVTNDSYFVGGWIEVGQNVITILTEGMLIPVPEGEYSIKVTNKGYVGRETVTVKRDEETRLDLSKVEIEEVAIGHVLFTITPEFGQLYVDGVMTDFEERVPLEYGIHPIRVECAGYETVRANIRVGSEMANISIELDKEEEASSSSSSSTSSSSADANMNSSASSSSMPSTSTSSVYTPVVDANGGSTITSMDSIISDNKRLYVEGPQGAEVYLDGTYIGVAPCNTQKVTGNHTITLSKSGYETKSYTINVGNDGKDLTMSFSELSAIQQ